MTDPAGRRQLIAVRVATALVAVLAATACTDPAGPRAGADGSHPDPAGPRAGADGDPAAAGRADRAYQVLVFTRTVGFRHDSIPAGVAALRQLGEQNNFRVTATEDPAVFTAAELARYAAVVFLNTTGDVLDTGQQAVFEAYIGAGGGFVGVHAAADTEYQWPFYGELVGAYFAAHPAVQRAEARVVDRTHPATAHLPATWGRVDEWYDFRSDAGRSARVLITLDESTYHGGRMGQRHPLAWCKAYRGGRSFYTGAGHTAAAYAEPAFRAHLLGGIRYAAGRAPADCGPGAGGADDSGPALG